MKHGFPLKVPPGEGEVKGIEKEILHPTLVPPSCEGGLGDG